MKILVSSKAQIAIELSGVFSEYYNSLHVLWASEQKNEKRVFNTVDPSVLHVSVRQRILEHVMHLFILNSVQFFILSLQFVSNVALIASTLLSTNVMCRIHLKNRKQMSALETATLTNYFASNRFHRLSPISLHTMRVCVCVCARKRVSHSKFPI